MPYFDIEPCTLLRFDHSLDLEEADATRAWDGARVEVQVGGGAWQVVTPGGGYSHTVLPSSSPLGKGTPCWSGRSAIWRSEIADLSAFAPGPARVRFRMAADDFLGFDGWFVDHVQLLYPHGVIVDVTPAAWGPAIGAPWPNPARERLMLPLSLARPARAEWSLYDLAGRRVATLWSGIAPAGPKTLEARLPLLPSGLYFARVEVGGAIAARARVAILR